MVFNTSKRVYVDEFIVIERCWRR